MSSAQARKIPRRRLRVDNRRDGGRGSCGGGASGRDTARRRRRRASANGPRRAHYSHAHPDPWCAVGAWADPGGCGQLYPAGRADVRDYCLALCHAPRHRHPRSKHTWPSRAGLGVPKPVAGRDGPVGQAAREFPHLAGDRQARAGAGVGGGCDGQRPHGRALAGQSHPAGRKVICRPAITPRAFPTTRFARGAHGPPCHRSPTGPSQAVSTMGSATSAP